MHRVSLNCTSFIMVQNKMLIRSLKEFGEKWRLVKPQGWLSQGDFMYIVQYSYQFPLFKICRVIVFKNNK
jgi:hypothetical protein